MAADQPKATSKPLEVDAYQVEHQMPLVSQYCNHMIVQGDGESMETMELATRPAEAVRPLTAREFDRVKDKYPLPQEWYEEPQEEMPF